MAIKECHRSGFSTFFLPFTPCQLHNIKFTPCFLFTYYRCRKMYISIIKFTPRIGKITPMGYIYPRLRAPAIDYQGSKSSDEHCPANGTSWHNRSDHVVTSVVRRGAVRSLRTLRRKRDSVLFLWRSNLSQSDFRERGSWGTEWTWERNQQGLFFLSGSQITGGSETRGSLRVFSRKETSWIYYCRGGKIAARGPHVARHSVFSGLQKH